MTDQESKDAFPRSALWMVYILAYEGLLQPLRLLNRGSACSTHKGSSSNVPTRVLGLQYYMASMVRVSQQGKYEQVLLPRCVALPPRPSRFLLATALTISFAKDDRACCSI
jgi:hypothetical protein